MQSMRRWVALKERVISAARDGSLGNHPPHKTANELPGQAGRVLQHACTLGRVPEADDALRARRSDARLIEHVEGVQIETQAQPFRDRHALVNAGAEVRDPGTVHPLIAQRIETGIEGY